MDTKTTSSPATPIPVGQRAEIITCLCFVNTLAVPSGTIVQRRCTRRSAIIRRPIAISKPQIFRVRIGEKHLQHILAVQLFISHLAIFSHNLLNETIAHFPCYFLEHFWSRIKVRQSTLTSCRNFATLTLRGLSCLNNYIKKQHHACMHSLIQRVQSQSHGVLQMRDEHEMQWDGKKKNTIKYRDMFFQSWKTTVMTL